MAGVEGRARGRAGEGEAALALVKGGGDEAGEDGGPGGWSAAGGSLVLDVAMRLRDGGVGSTDVRHHWKGSLQSIQSHCRLSVLLGESSVYALLEGSCVPKQVAFQVPDLLSYVAHDA